MVRQACGTFSIQIHKLTGNLIRSFVTEASSQIGYFRRDFKLGVLPENIILIAGSGQLVLYSQTGELLSRTPCELCTGEYIGMAIVGDDSVVLAVRDSNTVFRIDVVNGEVMWTSKHVKVPEGVVCYRNRYVLVTNCNPDTWIWILDADTGEMMFVSYYIL